MKKELSDRGLMPEEWGGKTVMVPVSAKKRENIDGLLEMILLVTEMSELKANPKRDASGTVLEAKLDRGRGPVATVLVQNGTLKVGDTFIAGPIFGKVRALFDDRGRNVRESRAVDAGRGARPGGAARRRATPSRWSTTRPRPSRSRCTGSMQAKERSVVRAPRTLEEHPEAAQGRRASRS